jgi:hypothetical protein
MSLSYFLLCFNCKFDFNLLTVMCVGSGLTLALMGHQNKDFSTKC